MFGLQWGRFLRIEDIDLIFFLTKVTNYCRKSLLPPDLIIWNRRMEIIKFNYSIKIGILNDTNSFSSGDPNVHFPKTEP